MSDISDQTAEEDLFSGCGSDRDSDINAFAASIGECLGDAEQDYLVTQAITSRKTYNSVANEPSCSTYGRDTEEQPQPSVSHADEDGEEPDDVSSGGTISSAGEEEEDDGSDIKQKCLKMIVAQLEKASGKKREVLQKNFQAVRDMDTPNDIYKKYQTDINKVKAQLAQLQMEQTRRVKENETYWMIVKQTIPRCGQATRIRMAKKPKEGVRKKRKCPAPWCVAKIQNVHRHLAVAHRFTSLEQRQTVLDAYRQEVAQIPRKHQKPSSSKSSSASYLRRCSVCDKTFRRLDSHLAHVHSLKRGSPRFKQQLSAVSPTVVYYKLMQ